MDKNAYLKREESRKLNSFQEYKSVRFAFGASLILGIIALLNSISFINGELKGGVLTVATIYLGAAFIQLIISNKIKADIFRLGEVKKSTRKIGFLLIALILTGNVFAAIAGFTLIKEEKSLEYSLNVYAILIAIATFLISLINIFKEYVANTFVIGMVGLVVLIGFYIFTMTKIAKYVKGKEVDKRLKPIAVMLIVSSVTGNLFALVLGLIILRKMKNTNSEISIEWIDMFKRLFRNNMATLGMFVVIFFLSISIYSYLTFDYSIAVDNNYATLLLPPSLMYPFGTDDFGRCVFTRIVFGARISLVVGIIATTIPMIVGGTLGAVSGYYGGRVDNIAMRLLDVLYAVPGILLAIAIVAAFGANTLNLILALSIGGISPFARIVRATVLSVSNNEFVEAAKACGARDFNIIFQHIIPNSLAPVIVRATLGIGGAVLSTSSLSYLGLGVEPQIPEWGNILKVGSTYLESNPYLAVYPGLAIILIVLSFNYFGDGLRDALDPKLK